MRYEIVFSPEAQGQIVELYRYISQYTAPVAAQRYTDAIIEYCEGLRSFPHRGANREDLRPGLRITNYKGRTVIAFSVNDQVVSIVGVFYGGQDYETLLQSDSTDGADHEGKH